MIQRSMTMNNLVLATDSLDAAVDSYSRDVDAVLAAAEQTVRYMAYLGLQPDLPLTAPGTYTAPSGLE